MPSQLNVYCFLLPSSVLNHQLLSWLRSRSHQYFVISIVETIYFNMVALLSDLTTSLLSSSSATFSTDIIYLFDFFRPTCMLLAICPHLGNLCI